MATMAAGGSCHALPTWPSTRSAVGQGRSQNLMQHNQVSQLNEFILSPRTDICSSVSSQHGASRRLPSRNALTKPQHVTLDKLTGSHRSTKTDFCNGGVLNFGWLPLVSQQVANNRRGGCSSLRSVRSMRCSASTESEKGIEEQQQVGELRTVDTP
jgi:hypothetical protein